MNHISENMGDISESLAYLNRYAGEAILDHQSGDLTYVPVHIFADDLGLLQQMNIDADTCSSVDCYWLLGAKIAFVSVFYIHQGVNLGPCRVTYEPHSDRVRRYDFIVRTESSPIYRVPYERVLRKLREWFDLQQKLPRERTVIYDFDLYTSVLV